MRALWLRRDRAVVDDKGVLPNGLWCARVGRQFTLSSPLKRKPVGATFPTHWGRIERGSTPVTNARAPGSYPARSQRSSAGARRGLFHRCTLGTFLRVVSSQRLNLL
jgi:hypothetical protein